MTLLLSSLSFALDIQVPADGELGAVCSGLAGESYTETVNIYVDPTVGTHTQCDLTNVSDVRVVSSVDGTPAQVSGMILSGVSGVTVKDLELGLNTQRTNLQGSDCSELELLDLSLSAAYSHGILLTGAEAVTIDGLQTTQQGRAGANLVQVGATPNDAGDLLVIRDVQASGLWARIYATTQGTGTVDLEGISLDGAQSDDDGGCLSLDANGSSQPVTLKDVDLSVCSSGADGGAAFLASGTYEVENSTFQSSSAAGTGGGIHFGDSTLKATNVRVAGNTGTPGGGIAGERGGSLEGQDVEIWHNVGGGITTWGPLTLSGGSLCGNDASALTGQLGAAVTVNGLETTPVDLTRVEVRGNTAGVNYRTLFFVTGALDVDHLSVWDNDAESLVDPGSSSATIRSSLIANLDEGYATEVPVGSYNYWFDVADPNPSGDLWIGDHTEGVTDPGMGLWPAGGDCETLLYLQPGSPLVDAGDPSRQDPDGDPVEDIGAHYLGETPEDSGDSGETGLETGETGGETGHLETGETGSPETGEPAVQASTVTLMGGCGRSAAGGSAALVLGLGLLLGRRRRG